jgi:hypothetical protein
MKFECGRKSTYRSQRKAEGQQRRLETEEPSSLLRRYGGGDGAEQRLSAADDDRQHPAQFRAQQLVTRDAISRFHQVLLPAGTETDSSTREASRAR